MADLKAIGEKITELKKQVIEARTRLYWIEQNVAELERAYKTRKV